MGRVHGLDQALHLVRVIDFCLRSYLRESRKILALLDAGTVVLTVFNEAMVTIRQALGYSSAAARQLVEELVCCTLSVSIFWAAVPG